MLGRALAEVDPRGVPLTLSKMAPKSLVEGLPFRSSRGILNGTTNFILTKMIREGMAFDDALKLAQQLGYAERDPSADVEGIDACRG